MLLLLHFDLKLQFWLPSLFGQAILRAVSAYRRAPFWAARSVRNRLVSPFQFLQHAVMLPVYPCFQFACPFPLASSSKSLAHYCHLSGLLPIGLFKCARPFPARFATPLFLSSRSRLLPRHSAPPPLPASKSSYTSTAFHLYSSVFQYPQHFNHIDTSPT